MEQEIIYYAIAINYGDSSVGINPHVIVLGDEDKTGKNILLDLSVYAEDEHESIKKEFREHLLNAMSLSIDEPKIYFDYEWER